MSSLSVLLFTLILPLVMLLQGCSPGGAGKPLVRPIEGVKRPIPTQIEVEPGSRRLIVRWSMESEEGVAGYNVFVCPRQKQPEGFPDSIPCGPFNGDLFLGDVDISDPWIEYVSEGLINFMPLLVTVSVVYTDGSEARSREMVGAICRPTGEFRLPIRGRGKSGAKDDGFNFEEEKTVGARDTLNDLYFFSKDGIDYLNSPSRQEGFLRENLLTKLSFRGDINQLRSRMKKLSELVTIHEGDKIAILPGDWLLVSQKNCSFCLNTLVQVTSLDGVGNDRTVTCRYFSSGTFNSFDF